MRAKITVTGNPVRPNALAAIGEPYPEIDGRLRLLVTGGSQGARVMADVVPAAIAALPAESARSDNRRCSRRGPRTSRASPTIYERAGVKADIAPFFSDLPLRIARAQLVIARSGASTVSELAVIGRASILVPLPHALDQDQAANAAVLQATGAAEVVRQENFTPRFLSERLARLSSAIRRRCKLRAACAKAAGVADAAQRLADLALGVAKAKTQDTET